MRGFSVQHQSVVGFFFSTTLFCRSLKRVRACWGVTGQCEGGDSTEHHPPEGRGSLQCLSAGEMIPPPSLPCYHCLVSGGHSRWLLPRHILPVRTQSGGGYPSDHEYQVRELLRWFKHEFFSWVNEPKCQSCQSGGTKLVWMAPPSEEEQSFGAGRVEVYQCQSCQSITRFPRYNNAGKLLETRRGRCGEWAQVRSADVLSSPMQT